MKKSHILSTSAGIIFCIGTFIFLQQHLPPIEIPAIPFYFIRHGQTDYNLLVHDHGMNNAPLNKTGIAQVQVAAEKLEGLPIKTIFASSYLRTQETAALIAEKIHLPVITLSEFIEYDREHESLKQFQQRVEQGLQQALRYPGPVLIVAHGGTGKMIQYILHINGHYFGNAVPIFFEPSTDKKHWKEHAIR